MKKWNSYFLKNKYYENYKSLRYVRTIQIYKLDEDKMTEILINYQWNEVLFSNAKIINLKRKDYEDINFIIRVTKENKEYDYIKLKSLPSNVDIDFIYNDDKIRIRFAHNVSIQDFFKENEYTLDNFKICEYMTEPLFKKENK